MKGAKNGKMMQSFQGKNPFIVCKILVYYDAFATICLCDLQGQGELKVV